ncbi:hypothetical protein B1218_37115 [Pseudomonas ogarae]|nr:hypothetical protein B1218_37115 [Pseudomonas ogarae]
MNPGQCGLWFERWGVITMSTDKVSVHGSGDGRWRCICAATGSAVGRGGSGGRDMGAQLVGGRCDSWEKGA